jgi:membrane-associated protease RseP (regulator of RpoE activity)
MILGFEMFPRRVQPVLDRWVGGELTTEAFLREVDWAEIWGFDADLYLPLLQFARQNRVPMVALNVDRALVARVGREGWDAVAPEDREGVSDPAPASEAYRRSLARVYTMKHRYAADKGGDQASPPGTSAEDFAKIFDDPGFRHFVEAQLTWDRAMAQALARARRSGGKPLVVGVVGRGHAEHGWGVPHQLDDLGVSDTAVLLPVDRAGDCGNLAPDIADAAFVVEKRDEPERPRPRLGVRIETTDAGVRVGQVIEGSVAEAAGIKVGDIVVAAAGFPVNKVTDLIEIVARQAPGTWLPVGVHRDGKRLELIARFPHPGEPNR